MYTGLMWCRRRVYDKGLLKQHRIPVPVIVVGNISVGGTGKSPLVIALVEYLRKQGFKPGVIARGYRGSSSFWPRAIVAADTAVEVGDEPLMIFRRCHVPVVVGPDRVRSAQLLVEKFQCNIVVSDDGYQHLALARDIDIVVIDGELGFGNGWCLPSGPLREARSEVARAHIQVVNSPRDTIGESAFAMHIEAEAMVRLDHPDTRRKLSAFAGQTVHAVAGLGNPERFFSTLKRIGLSIIPHVFPDHHIYAPEDFTFAGEQDVIIMTEKDAVKCTELAPSSNSWVLPVHARLSPEFFDLLKFRLDQICISATPRKLEPGTKYD